MRLIQLAILTVYITAVTAEPDVCSGLPDSPPEELQRFQLQVKILHKTITAENCVEELSDQSRKDILHYEAAEQLEVDNALYNHLLGLLSECRKLGKVTTPRPCANETEEETTPTSTPSTTTSTTTSTTSTLAPTTSAPTCSDGYIFGPSNTTCIRLVKRKVNWETAKTECEAAGEKLAVFPTEESVQWLLYIMRNDGDWRWGTIWFGAKDIGGTIRWQGRLTSIIQRDDPVWQQGEPDGGGCGCVWYTWQGLKDCTCTQTHFFICEQEM